MLRAAILLPLLSVSLAAQTGGVEGTVVDQTTGKPIARVHLLFAAGNDPYGDLQPYGAMSDSSGHFSVSSMQPGRYEMSAARTGYVQTENQKLSVKPGQQFSGFTVKLARAAMIAGRVVNENGDPVPEVSVALTAVPPSRMGQSASSAQSDDRGAFRILTGPGKFYLEATPFRSGQSGPPEVRSDGTAEALYGPTFYPGSATKERAAVVEVEEGRDVEGLEIRLATPVSRRPLNVSGTVSGIPAGGHAFVLIGGRAEAESMMGPVGTPVGPDGKFSASGLLPGAYEAVAMVGAEGKHLRAQARFTLDTADIVNLELALSEPGELVGTLTGVAKGKRTIRLEPVDPFPFLANEPSDETNPDGSFHIGDVSPGKFHVVVDPLPESAYLQMVEVDDAKVADGVIEVNTGRVPRVRITVGLDGAVVSGSVVDPAGEPVDYASVFLLADAKEIHGATGIPIDDGKYRFQGIRAGKYRLFVLEGSQLPDDADSAARDEAIGKLFAAAEEFEIKPGDRITKDVKLPAKERADAAKR